jgi:Tfp pilus assembly protein PilF
MTDGQDEHEAQVEQPARRVNRHAAKLQNQLFELDEAITLYPNAPMNYVLRGEYYLQIGYNQLAEQDFKRALALATDEFNQSSWGLVAQVAQDRARRGLKIARQRQL